MILLRPSTPRPAPRAAPPLTLLRMASLAGFKSYPLAGDGVVENLIYYLWCKDELLCMQARTSRF